jgi:hypothetical protein
MTDRDTFAAAALTGLLGGRQAYRSDDGAGYAKSAWNIANAMLAARGDAIQSGDAAPTAGVSASGELQFTLTDAECVAVEASRGFCEARREYWIADMLSHLLARAARGTTDHDAAPAATASDTENQAGGRRAATSAGEAGTGDTRSTQEPAAWGVYRGDYLVTAFATQEVAAAWVRDWPKREYRIVPLYAAPPAGSVTLTDAEREVLSEARDDFEADGFAAFAAVIDGLLARATKEQR